MHDGQQGTLAEQLAQAAEDQQDQGEAEAHQQSVEAGAQHAVLRREGLGATEDHAVGGDQRDEDAEDLVQLVGPGLHQQFDAGGQHGDDHDERRQPDRLAHRAAHQRYRGIGAGQHEHGGQAQAEGVDRRVAGAQQRAQAEQLDQARVVAPQAVAGDLAEILFTHVRQPLRGRAGVRGWRRSSAAPCARRGPRRAG